MIKRIGEVIRRRREAKGLKQEDLAYRVGTSPANLSRIETGGQSTSLDLLTAIAIELGLHVYQLIAEAEGVDLPVAAPLISKDDATVLNHYHAMEPSQKDAYKAVGAALAKPHAAPRKRTG